MPQQEFSGKRIENRRMGDLSSHCGGFSWTNNRRQSLSRLFHRRFVSQSLGGHDPSMASEVFDKFGWVVEVGSNRNLGTRVRNHWAQLDNNLPTAPEATGGFLEKPFD